jgi:diguanylate cyclase (GGDEF)-like protein
MYNKNFSNTVKTKVIIFSMIFFVVITIGGSAAFSISMRQMAMETSDKELRRIIENKRILAENRLNKEIGLLVTLSESPLIRRFFMDVNNPELRALAIEEIVEYERAFPDHIVSWGTDEGFYVGSTFQVSYDPENPYHQWYPATRDQKESFNLAIDYDYISTYKVNLFINAPVREYGKAKGRGTGVVTTQINLNDFLNFLYTDSDSEKAEVFLFTKEGVITGASDPNIVVRSMHAVAGAKDGAITVDKTSVTEFLGKTGELVMNETKSLDAGATRMFTYKDKQYAVSKIDLLNWYILVAIPAGASLALQNSVISVFASIIFIILVIFIIFNIFIFSLLNPLIKMDGTLQTILSSIPNPFLVVDDQSKITYISKALAQMTLKQNAEVCTGRRIFEIFGNRDLKTLFDDTFQKPGFSESTNEVVMNGRRMFFKVISDDLTGDIRGKFVHLTDITVAMLSGLMDPLTGLANRRNFDRRLEEEWQRATRDKLPLSLMMIDVDYFKFYNDTYGHPQGDVVLKTIADIFAGAAKRRTDMPARWGGEEFGILMANTDLNGALQIAELIRSQVEKAQIPLIHGEGMTSVTISVGVACVIPSQRDDVKNFISQADQYLYMAKHRGRNQVCSG